MSIRMLALAAVVLAGLAVAGCQGGPESPKAQTFTSQAEGYSITYPGDWRQFKGGPTSDFSAIPLDQTDLSGVFDNLLVHTEMLKDPLTLDEYFGIKTAVMAKVPEELEFKELERGQATIGGMPAKKIVYTLKMDDTPVTSVAYFVVSGSRGYTVLATIATARFAARKAALDEMVNSLKLEGVAATAPTAPTAPAK